MINRARKIYVDNASTFYDYRTNRKQSQVPRVTLIVALSAALALVAPVTAPEILSAAITVQAILIGFSFSVMFFLVQDRTSIYQRRPVETQSPSEESLEKQLDDEQLALLSKELFWNISYFNLVAFASLLVALSIMIPNIWDRIDNIMANIPIQNAKNLNFAVPAMISSMIAQWALMVLFIESVYTFIRTVGRVNFLFEQRMG